jgi:hypothetical protein
MNESLIAVAGEYWRLWFLNKNKPLPWTPEAKEKEAVVKGFLRK